MDRQRDDWLRAAMDAMRRGGIEGVRVESLARRLRVTKGSFYWHFKDRRDLLESLIALWEEETEWLIGEANRRPNPGERLLAFFELVLQTRTYPPDTAIFAWARFDRAIAQRAVATEQKRIEFIAKQLREAGIDRAEAQRRSEIGYLATLGWLERSTRADNDTDFGTLTKFLFTFLLEHPGRNHARHSSSRSAAPRHAHKADGHRRRRTASSK